MNHQDLEAELPWFVNGSLAPDLAPQVERSLNECPQCAADVAEMRALRDALRDDEARAAEPPASLYNDVLARIGSPSATTRTGARTLRMPSVRIPRRVLQGAGLAFAACLALLFVVPRFFGDNRQAATSESVGFTSDGAHFGQDVPVAAPPEPKTAVMQRSAPGGAAGAADTSTVAGQTTNAATSAGRDRASAQARQLARTANVGLLVGDVAQSLAKIQRLADEQFGVITALQDHAPAVSGGTHTAEVTLSVPDDRFDRTLDAVGALGGITAREVTTEDLTDSIVDGQARLRNLRHEEADLVRIMDRQGKVADILDVEQQLASTRHAIEELDAQTKAMQHRVAYATIAIDLSDEREVPVATPGPLSQIGAQWHEAMASLWHVTLGLIGLALWLIAFAPYWLAAALVAYLAYRRFFRPALR